MQAATSNLLPGTFGWCSAACLDPFRTAPRFLGTNYLELLWVFLFQHSNQPLRTENGKTLVLRVSPRHMPRGNSKPHLLIVLIVAYNDDEIPFYRQNTPRVLVCIKCMYLVSNFFEKMSLLMPFHATDVPGTYITYRMINHRSYSLPTPLPDPSGACVQYYRHTEYCNKSSRVHHVYKT